MRDETVRWDHAIRLASGLAMEVGPMLALALPVVVSELGWMAMGLIDTMMVGGLGAEAIGAVGIGNVVFFGVAIFGIGLLLGMDTLVSQSFGAGDAADCHRSLVQGVYLALIVSAPMMGFVAAVIPLLRRSGIDPSVLELAIPYLRIMNWGLPPLLVYSAVRRYLQGMNLAWPIMAALAAANLANWFGNWVLVSGRLGFPAMGVAGSGWATVASRVSMLGFVILYAVWHGAKYRTGLLHVSLRPDLGRIVRLARLGLPSGAQLTLELLVFVAAALLAGKIGPDALAAHEVVLQIAGTAFMVPLGISSAAAIRVGQAIGRGDRAGAVRSGWTALALGAGVMSISGLLMLLAPGPMLGIFTADTSVLAAARSLLIAAAVFQVFDGLQVVASGALRGAGETKIPMLANLVAHWAIGLPIGYAMAFPAAWGVLGLWIGLASGLIAAGILLLVAWIRQVDLL